MKIPSIRQRTGHDHCDQVLNIARRYETLHFGHIARRFLPTAAAVPVA